MAQGRALAGALAGDDGEVIDLALVGVRNLRRRQSQAEVHALRKALLGLGPSSVLSPRDPPEMTVGYVCAGRSVAAALAAALALSPRLPASEAPAGAATAAASATFPAPAGLPDAGVIAVSDHANLTWESPLTGSNDDSLGPRFPVTAGLYEPTLAAARLVPPFPARQGVVAGVRDELDLTPFESRVVAAGFLEEGQEFAAVSSELVPVAILAAHLGFRVAAGVVVPAEAIESVEQSNQ
jgi:hypothetical protein